MSTTGLIDLSSDRVDVLIHNIKEHLVEIKTINNLLRQSINLSAFERRKYSK